MILHRPCPEAVKGKAKQPYAIAMKDGSPFGVAGLWENRRRHHRRASSAICVLYPIKASQSLPYFRTGSSSLQVLPVMARWRCNAAMASAFNLPSEMWRSRPSRIASDMKAEAMASALSRAVLGGRHAQSMWVKAEQLNLTETSAGCAMAGVMAASRDSAAAITGFIITSPCTRNLTTQRFCDDIVRLRVLSAEAFGSLSPAYVDHRCVAP